MCATTENNMALRLYADHPCTYSWRWCVQGEAIWEVVALAVMSKHSVLRRLSSDVVKWTILQHINVRTWEEHDASLYYFYDALCVYSWQNVVQKNDK